MSEIIRGIGAAPGIGYGPAYLLFPPSGPDLAEPAGTPADLERVQIAFREISADFQQRAADTAGARAEILHMTAGLARDKGLINNVLQKIQSGVGATTAVGQATAEYMQMLISLGGYMAERITDLESVRDCVIAKLRGLPLPGLPEITTPGILVAVDLAPAQVAELDTEKVLGIVLEKSGATSHTAILAESMEIPTVVAVAERAKIKAGDNLLVRGREGIIYINPQSVAVQKTLAAATAQEKILTSLRGPGRTKDGCPVHLQLNIASAADAQRLAAVDSEGIGLLRTEFMFLSRPQAPSYREQVEQFQKIFHAFSSHPVTVRTLDVGADKPLPFLERPAESNPALGQRGIRLSQAEPELFMQQLQAIGAAANEFTQVMAPLVSTVAEVEWFIEQARAAGLHRVGIMVETPAAALNSRALLENLDFVSIGTNDLTQYVMAADRLNPQVNELNNPWQPPVLELVERTCQAGEITQTQIGVCGEAAGDPLLALVLVGMGVRVLSMAAAKIPAVRLALAQHTLAECQEIAQAARRGISPEQARAAAAQAAKEIIF